MTTYQETANKYFEKLDMFSLAITRAHGKNHPEAFEVRELFETINAKTKQAAAAKPNLDTDFTQLRQITNNYTIPGDVCGTFAAVYNMLAETDAAYSA